MSTNLVKRILLVVLVAVIALPLVMTSAETSYAQGPDGRPDRDGRDRNRIIDVVRTVMDTAAEALGVEPREIFQNMEDGQTLSDYLTANGVDPNQVTADAKAKIEAAVQTAVDEGKITEERATTLLENVDTVIENVLNRAKGERGEDRPRGERFEESEFIQTIADSLGITPEEFVAQLQEEQTIAEVISANGGDVEAITQTLIADATERINQAVTDGKLTQERADTMVENLETRINDFLSGNRPPRPERPFRDGGPRGGQGQDQGQGQGVLE